MEIYVIKGYDILLMGNTETPQDEIENTKYKRVTAALKIINKAA